MESARTVDAWFSDLRFSGQSWFSGMKFGFCIFLLTYIIRNTENLSFSHRCRTDSGLLTSLKCILITTQTGEFLFAVFAAFPSLHPFFYFAAFSLQKMTSELTYGKNGHRKALWVNQFYTEGYT